MTDREKLIGLLLTEPWTIQARGNSKRLAVAGMVADHLIANGVTFATDNHVGGKWIPVAERLPENEGVVLVYGSRGGIYTAEFRMFGEYHHWHKLNSKYHNCAPTHWMPLPEPPADMRKGENG